MSNNYFKSVVSIIREYGEIVYSDPDWPKTFQLPSEAFDALIAIHKLLPLQRYGFLFVNISGYTMRKELPQMNGIDKLWKEMNEALINKPADRQ